MLITLAACTAAEEPTEAPTEPAPQPHTVAPTEQEPEAEWTIIDRTMSLEDGDNTYAEGSDFVAFAIIGSDDSAELRFRFTDEIAAMLREQSPDIAYFLAMDGEKIGGAKLSDDCSEATLVGDYTFEELCELSNKIRGFE